LGRIKAVVYGVGEMGKIMTKLMGKEGLVIVEVWGISPISAEMWVK